MTATAIITLIGLIVIAIGVVGSVHLLTCIVEQQSRKLDDIMCGIHFISEQLNKKNNETERRILD